MPISSPFTAGCFLGLNVPRPEPSELEVLARQLQDIENDKFRKPKNRDKARNTVRYDKIPEN